MLDIRRGSGGHSQPHLLASLNQPCRARKGTIVDGVIAADHINGCGLVDALDRHRSRDGNYRQGSLHCIGKVKGIGCYIRQFRAATRGGGNIFAAHRTEEIK